MEIIKMTKKLLGIIASTVIFTAAAVGLIKSCQENSDASRPGVDYMVKGKTVIKKRFDTQAEFDNYLNSEQGKREAAYYMQLNSKKQ